MTAPSISRLHQSRPLTDAALVKAIARMQSEMLRPAHLQTAMPMRGMAAGPLVSPHFLAGRGAAERELARLGCALAF